MQFPELLRLYRATLLEDVVPFWTKHAIDADGGINTCIADDGTLNSRDRWNWSQWRAVWVFSKLYNSVEPRPEWLDTARGIYQFVTSNGPLEDGHWPLLLDGDGEVLRGYESLYVDGFAIYGLVEYWRATQNPDVLALALQTFEAAERALASSTPPPTYPYPIPPGRRPHGLSMIFSLVYHELADASGDARVKAAAKREHHRVMNHFLRSERGFVLEWLNQDDSECPSPEGTAVCPGHAIESMWFQIHLARASDDQAAIRSAIDAIHFHLEQGWDSEQDGIFLAIDADGSRDVAWDHADTKLWWPHTEALYATLLAHELCQEPWCLEWHERIRKYCWAHYPVPAYGEWRQKLTRQGEPIDEVLILPVKDPFHLPRALIYCIEVLRRLLRS